MLMNSPRKTTKRLIFFDDQNIDGHGWTEEKHTWKETTATEAREVYIIDNAFFRLKRPE